jgi:hypothetical protein
MSTLLKIVVITTGAVVVLAACEWLRRDMNRKNVIVHAADVAEQEHAEAVAEAPQFIKVVDDVVVPGPIVMTEDVMERAREAMLLAANMGYYDPDNLLFDELWNHRTEIGREITFDHHWRGGAMYFSRIVDAQLHLKPGEIGYTQDFIGRRILMMTNKDGRNDVFFDMYRPKQNTMIAGQYHDPDYGVVMFSPLDLTQYLTDACEENIIPLDRQQTKPSQS